MNIAIQMKKVAPLVASILRENQIARDDDNLLCVMVWERQHVIKPNTKFITFKKGLISGKYAQADTITRTRRKLQEKHAELRGDLYDERHTAEEIMANQMKFEFDY